jgi:hypothetical protein
MKPIVNKAKSFKEAEQWGIQQEISMTYKARMAAARQLKERVYGKNVKDVRECHKRK